MRRLNGNIVDILAAPWAIIPAKLEQITEIYAARLRGEQLDKAAIEAQIGKALDNEPTIYEVVDGVAILPVQGVMAKRMNLFMEISGGVSTEMLTSEIDRMQSDPNVHSAIYWFDTPGGAVDGTERFASKIFDSSRNGKPAVAFGDGLIASAGIWAGTAPPRLFLAGPTTMAGSIGVVAQHIDRSQRDQLMGFKVTDITAGKYKRIASENAPLTEEGRAVIQDQLDRIYSIFVDTVAKHRGVTSDVVLEKMADGRLFMGQQAIDAGLADGFSNLQELVAMLNRERSARARAFLGGL